MTQTSSQPFQKAIQAGHSAAWEQNWEQAAAHYREALQIDPQHPQALVSLGLALYELERFDESLKAYLQAIKAAPEDPVPLEKASEISQRVGDTRRACETAFLAGELYARGRDVEKAIECWTRAAWLNPEHLNAHWRLAQVYDRIGQKNQSVNSYIAVASLLQHQGQTDKAIQTIQRAQQIMPGNAQLSQLLTMVRTNRLLPKPGRPKTATGSLRPSPTDKEIRTDELKALPAGAKKEQPDPVTEARQLSLSRLASVLFDAEEVEPLESTRRGFQDILSGDAETGGRGYDKSRVALYLSQVIDLETRGEVEAAARELEKAISIGLDDQAAVFNLGMLHFEAERRESALRTLRKVSDDPEYAIAANLLMGRTHRSMNKVRDAAFDYLHALQHADAQAVAPEFSDALRQLYEPLLEDFRRNAQEDALDSLCTNIDELLSKPGWRERVRQARQQLPPSAPGSPPMPLAEILTEVSSGMVVESLFLIHQLTAQHRYRTAIEEAYWAIQHAPTYLPLHTYVAELFLSLGYQREAAEKLAVVARAYEMRGEQRQVVATLQRLVEIAPLNLSARIELIDAQVAARNFTAALQQSINLAGAYYSRAELDLARKAYAEALRLAQQSSVEDSWRVRILHHMADIDLQSLEWRQAQRIYEQIRSIDPEDEKARLNLIDLQLRLGQQAQAFSELDSYLATLMERRKVDAAVRFLEQLLSDRPDQTAIRLRLAELYRTTGKSSDSLKHINIMLEQYSKARDLPNAAKVARMALRLNPPDAARYQAIIDTAG